MGIVGKSEMGAVAERVEPPACKFAGSKSKALLRRRNQQKRTGEGKGKAAKVGPTAEEQALWGESRSKHLLLGKSGLDKYVPLRRSRQEEPAAGGHYFRRRQQRVEQDCRKYRSARVASKSVAVLEGDTKIDAQLEAYNDVTKHSEEVLNDKSLAKELAVLEQLPQRGLSETEGQKRPEPAMRSTEQIMQEVQSRMSTQEKQEILGRLNGRESFENKFGTFSDGPPNNVERHTKDCFEEKTE